jgi:hypothetical protein
MVIKTQNGFNSQQFYFDYKSKTIRSMRTKSYSWEIQNAGRSTNMRAYTTNSGWFQIFKWNAEKGAFYNVYNNKQLDVAGGRDEEGNNVQIYKANDSPAQKWKLTYVKDSKAI